MSPSVGSTPNSITAVIPTQHDVLFGRGSVISSHPGNEYYRSLVDGSKSSFIHLASKREKRAVAVSVMQQLHNLQPPGRFLIEDHTGLAQYHDTNPSEQTTFCDKELDKSHPLRKMKVWVEVDAEKAIEKVLHRLREKEKIPPHPSSANKIGENDVKIGISHRLASEGGAYNSNMGVDLLQHDVFPKNEEEEENEIGQFDDLFDDDMEESDAAIRGEGCGGIDDEFKSFLRSFSLDHDNHDVDEYQPKQQLSELTLEQWVNVSRSKLLKSDAAETDSDQKGYIRAVLHIAFKLTDFLIEAERDEQSGNRNPVPLESITFENVLIRSKGKETHQEVIEYVWLMSSIEESSDTGTVMDRLFATGNILYKLFSGNEAYHAESLDVKGIAWYDDDENDNHEQKKRTSQGQLTNSSDRTSNCIGRLALQGIPRSVRALVQNLLDCGKGDFCDEDDAYSSFLDLKKDISLMLDDPSRFLDDIQVSNGLPTLDICDKLYGRECEVAKLDEIYRQHINIRDISGITHQNCIIISGGAGVGKSRLAMHVEALTSAESGYFCAAKFQQNNIHVKPLDTIGAIFNSLCDRFVQDASPLQLKSASEELSTALGSQASLLAGVVHGLLKLMPSCTQLEETSSNCVDAPMSMRYLFGELLRIVSSHSRRSISLLVDNVQFADLSSLLLIGNLLFSAGRCESSIFFVFCHRDNDHNHDNGAFDAWLSSISMFVLEELKVDNMTADSVNSLVSDALHLSPRITSPLATVLHHKTMGNPLFVRQLIVSLTREGYIHFDLSAQKWAWDLKKITNQEISESVLLLLMKEMKRLPPDLQQGLRVASCLGSEVKRDVLVILSKYLEIGDLIDILRQVSEKGFMNVEGDGVTFSFAHDKIQQAAYELMSEEQQKANHMQFGLALSLHTANMENNEIFFTAIAQVNKGGPDCLYDTSQKGIIARLNLQAGKLSIVLSEHT